MDRTIELARFGDELIGAFFDKVDVRMLSGCWEWSGTLTDCGYGLLWDPSGVRGRQRLSAHRLSVEIHGRPIPEGMVVDHLCRNRRCCNPNHLEIVTREENTMRGNAWPAQNARANYCKKGHPLFGDNLRIYVYKGRSFRKCIICERSPRVRRKTATGRPPVI